MGTCRSAHCSLLGRGGCDGWGSLSAESLVGVGVGVRRLRAFERKRGINKLIAADGGLLELCGLALAGGVVVDALAATDVGTDEDTDGSDKKRGQRDSASATTLVAPGR